LLKKMMHKITLIKASELKNLLDSYMKIFCKNGRSISESTFAVYYPWIERALQKGAGGGHEEPNVEVFSDDIEKMKRTLISAANNKICIKDKTSGET